MKIIEDFIALRTTKRECFVRSIKHFDLSKAKSQCKICHGGGTIGWINVTLEGSQAKVRLVCPKCDRLVYVPPPPPPPAPREVSTFGYKKPGILKRFVKWMRRFFDDKTMHKTRS